MRKLYAVLENFMSREEGVHVHSPLIYGPHVLSEEGHLIK